MIPQKSWPDDFSATTMDRTHRCRKAAGLDGRLGLPECTSGWSRLCANLRDSALARCPGSDGLFEALICVFVAVGWPAPGSGVHPMGVRDRGCGPTRMGPPGRGGGGRAVLARRFGEPARPRWRGESATETWLRPGGCSTTSRPVAWPPWSMALEGGNASRGRRRSRCPVATDVRLPLLPTRGASTGWFRRMSRGLACGRWRPSPAHPARRIDRFRGMPWPPSRPIRARCQ